MNSKLNTVQIDRNTLKPVTADVINVYPGTEYGHFFTKQAEVPGAVITVRNTGGAVTLVASDGPEARIRIIPDNEFGGADLLEALGFALKGSGSDIHYSRLSNKAASLINAIVAVADALAE